MLSYDVRACERVSKSVILFSSLLTNDRVSCRYDKYGSKKRFYCLGQMFCIQCQCYVCYQVNSCRSFSALMSFVSFETGGLQT